MGSRAFLLTSSIGCSLHDAGEVLACTIAVAKTQIGTFSPENLLRQVCQDDQAKCRSTQAILLESRAMSGKALTLSNFIRWKL